MYYSMDEVRKNGVLTLEVNGVVKELDLNKFSDKFIEELTDAFNAIDFNGIGQKTFRKLNYSSKNELKEFSTKALYQELSGDKYCKGYIFAKAFDVTKAEMPYIFDSIIGIENISIDAESEGEEFSPKDITWDSVLEYLNSFYGGKRKINKMNVCRQYYGSILYYNFRSLGMDIDPLKFLKWFAGILKFWNQKMPYHNMTLAAE